MKKLVIVLCALSGVLAGVVGTGEGEGEGGGEKKRQRDVEAKALLSSLKGVHGLNRASVCVLSEGLVQRCEGALATAQWLVARYSCLEKASVGHMHVVRDSDGLSCADVQARIQMYEIRRVQSVMHPSYRYDLALLPLNRPYVTIDHHANTSYVKHLLKEWEPWMEKTQEMRLRPLSLGHTHVLLSTPMRMLVTTVILPALSLIALFMFVVFCTGTRDSIPYQAIEETEPEKTDSLSVYVATSSQA